MIAITMQVSVASNISHSRNSFIYSAKLETPFIDQIKLANSEIRKIDQSCQGVKPAGRLGQAKWEETKASGRTDGFCA